MPIKAKRTGHASSTSFKKGQRANPLGRPLNELSFSLNLKRKLASEYTSEEYEEAVAYVDAITDQVMRIASDPTTEPALKLAYIKEIADRTEGRPTQRQELTGAGGKDLNVVTFTLDTTNQETKE